MSIVKTIRNTLKKKPHTVPATLIDHLNKLYSQLKTANQEVRGIKNDSTGENDFKTAIYLQSTARLVNTVSVDISAGLILYNLVKELKPKYALELGTCIGGSAAYILSALPEDGYLLTLEGSEDIARIARDNLDSLYQGRYKLLLGMFDDTVPKINEHISRVDFAFVDDEHRAASTYRDMEYITPLMPDGGIIVFDDIDWDQAKESWREICQRKDCAYSFEPQHHGARRFGIWVKGSALEGYKGIPEVFELSGSQFLSYPWRLYRIVKRTLRKRTTK